MKTKSPMLNQSVFNFYQRNLSWFSQSSPLSNLDDPDSAALTSLLMQSVFTHTVSHSLQTLHLFSRDSYFKQIGCQGRTAPTCTEPLWSLLAHVTVSLVHVAAVKCIPALQRGKRYCSDRGRRGQRDTHTSWM